MSVSPQNQKKTSTDLLVEALKKANDPRLADIITRAESGYYNEYKSELPTPIYTLIDHLMVAGHRELARRAAAGCFDATEEESREWILTGNLT
jgi:hypothetical protein